MVPALNDRVWQMGQKDMERVETLRRSLGERSPTAEVVTAKPLSSDQQAALVRTFSALADRNVDLAQQVDPGLYVGLRVLRESVDRLLEDSRQALLRGEEPDLPVEVEAAENEETESTAQGEETEAPTQDEDAEATTEAEDADARE
jgi:hypothetical protein